MTHPTWYTPVIVVAFTVIAWLIFSEAPSPDLRASWIAGHFYALGATDMIYAGNEGYFSMLPADGWQDWSDAHGLEGPTYPFVYPPLWAAVASWAVPHVPYEIAKGVANVVNPALMAGMVWLAARCVDDRDVSVPMMTLVGCAFCIATLPGMVALAQNQPHILVAFLLVFAIERDRAGAPVAAGAALALAASLKLFPAIFVLLWIARGHWRPVAAFAVAGAALGGLSVLLAGWPLHRAFLDEIDAIRSTAMITHFTYGIDAILSGAAWPEAMMQVSDGSGKGWYVVQKPPLWQMASSIALATVLVLGVLAVRTAATAGRSPDVLIWPMLFIGVAFVSPLAWGYYYLPALAFLPHLLDRFGLRRGLLAMVALALPITPAGFSILSQADLLLSLPALTGAAIMLICAGLFALAIRRRRTAAGGPLRATPVSL